jgi:hypothetical protein
MKQTETNLGEKGEKREDKFHCIYCDYKCCVKFSYERHLLTSKHIKQVKMKQNETNETKKEKKEKKEKYTHDNSCDCGLVFNSRTTLWRHKKTCIIIEKSDIEQNTDKKDELINYLMKENQEFKNLILEIVKKDTTINNNSNNTTHTNSHNKSFNLNFFLNETCKDAMNIMDFIDSIKLQLSDLENVGNLGFVEGISKIIVKNLNSLDETKRPVHCTDSKREVMYVKDEDKWEKENENKQKMRKMIKHVTHKNSKLLKEFKTKYPGCEKSESKFSDKYDKLIIEAMGGKGDNDAEKEDKIIKKIAKNVSIDKYIE